MLDLYEALNLTKDANIDEIKLSYRNLAKLHHPDKGGDTEKFQKIALAYEILSDPKRKEKYDTTGAQEKEPVFEKKFQSLVDHLLLQIISQPFNDLKIVDVVFLIQDSVNDGLKVYLGQKKEAQDCLNKLLTIQERLSTIYDKSVINAVELRISAFNKTISSLSDEISFVSLCIEKLQDYKYRVDEKQTEIKPFKIGGFTLKSY